MTGITATTTSNDTTLATTAFVKSVVGSAESVSATDPTFTGSATINGTSPATDTSLVLAAGQASGSMNIYKPDGTGCGFSFGGNIVSFGIGGPSATTVPLYIIVANNNVMKLNTDRTINCYSNISFTSANGTGTVVSLDAMHNRLTSLESGGGGSLQNYRTNFKALQAGLAIGSRYRTGNTIKIVSPALAFTNTTIKESKHSSYTYGTFNPVNDSYTSGNYTSWGFASDYHPSSIVNVSLPWKCTIKMKWFTSNITYFRMWFGQSYSSWSASHQPQTSYSCGFQVNNNNTINTTNFSSGTLMSGFWSTVLASDHFFQSVEMLAALLLSLGKVETV